METLNPKTIDLIHSYFNLELGQVKVKCPYFINTRKRRAELRSLIGKGTPEEIIQEVKVYERVRKVDLNSMSEYEIRGFMIKEGIGIDCSGFAAHIITTEMKERKKNWKSQLVFSSNSLKSKLLRTIRFVENLSAKDLTSDENTVSIKVRDVKPFDMIRAYGLEDGYHVGVVSEVMRKNGVVESFKYIHSTKFYEKENGVREGTVIVKNINAPLEGQDWIDDVNGRNYFKEEYVGKDLNYSGLRRLKVLYNQ